MFALDNTIRYWLYSEPTDMRKSFYTLSGIVRNNMNSDPCNGDVYVFINKERNRIKLLRWEKGGMVLYSKLIEDGRLSRPTYSEGTKHGVEWRDLMKMIEGVIETPGFRRRYLSATRMVERYHEIV